MGEETLDLAGNELANEIPKGGIAVGLLASNLEEVGIPITPLVLMSQVRLRRALSEMTGRMAKGPEDVKKSNGATEEFP